MVITLYCSCFSFNTNPQEANAPDNKSVVLPGLYYLRVWKVVQWGMDTTGANVLDKCL